MKVTRWIRGVVGLPQDYSSTALDAVVASSWVGINHATDGAAVDDDVNGAGL